MRKLASLYPVHVSLQGPAQDPPPLLPKTAMPLEVALKAAATAAAARRAALHAHTQQPAADQPALEQTQATGGDPVGCQEPASQADDKVDEPKPAVADEVYDESVAEGFAAAEVLATAREVRSG